MVKKGVDHLGVCVVFFCHDGKGRFLLSKRTNKTRDEHGKWDPGGGGVNFGEPVLKALKREVKEEYSTNIIGAEFLGYRDVHRRDARGRRTHWLALDFKVQVNYKKVKNGDPKKIEKVEWFTFKTMPSPMHSQWPEFLRLYKKRLKE